MDTSTGNLLTGEDWEKMLAQKPQQAKFIKPVPAHLVPMLENMNRADRRKYYREHKSEFK